MKIKATVKYREEYIPPRCRKPRYRDAEKETTLNIRETTKEEAPIAFIVHSYDGDIEYRYYKGKLYVIDDWKNHHCGKSGLFPPEEIANYLRRAYDYYNLDYDTNRKALLEEARRHLLIDGVVYQTAGEPRYVVMTFGLGHNHGGTSLSVSEGYNPNISRDSYFSALDGEQAVAYANKVAAGRGDTNDVGKFKAKIDVLMPEAVKVKPRTQHGKGDEFMNDLESVISGSDSTAEAGLMCMLLTAAKINR